MKYSINHIKCENCGATLAIHRAKDERCPKNGEDQSLLRINEKEPWKEVKKEWEDTRFCNTQLLELLNDK
jgi:hypothetical protein